jgi:hypothetical protein
MMRTHPRFVLRPSKPLEKVPVRVLQFLNREGLDDEDDGDDTRVESDDACAGSGAVASQSTWNVRVALNLLQTALVVYWL